MSIAVISSCYGAYDEPAVVPQQTVDAEWIMVTDRQGFDFDGKGWTVIEEQRPQMHPRLAAKYAKCLPWEYTNADTTVWLDTSCRLLKPDSLEKILAAAGSAPMAQVVHPWRACIFDEAEECRLLGKYEFQPMGEQVDHYRRKGHPEKWGLWATGMIVRTDRKIGTEFGLRWLAEQVRWSYQDQLSHPFVLREMGLLPAPLPWALHGSGMFEWHNHRSPL